MLVRFLACGLAATVLLAAMGCNGDDGPQGTPLPTGRTAAPTAPKKADPISKQAAKFLAGVDGKYVYRYTGPLGDFKEGTLTVYRLGVNDRQDWKTNSFGFEATTITILGTDKNYLCTMAQGFNTCRAATVAELEGLRIISSPIYDALAALVTDADKFEVSDLPDETFAGQAGKCYHAFSETRIGQGPPSSEEIKACYTDAGAIVYFQRIVTPDSAAIQPGTYTVELQESGVAAPSDFEPTGTLQ